MFWLKNQINAYDQGDPDRIKLMEMRSIEGGSFFMDDKTREAMLEIIEEKKQKSAGQSGLKRSPGNIGNTRGMRKSQKKGGLFDK